MACAFDMFVSDRPHDSVRGLAFAREEISRGSGTAFDPAVVDVFLRCGSIGLGMAHVGALTLGHFDI